MIALAALPLHAAHRGRGMVLRVDRVKRTAIVSHGAIDGYMDAMVMEFSVPREADLAKLAPGTQIRFDADGASIERIEVIAESTGELKLSPPANELAIGARVPDFTLRDHLGRSTSLKEFAGNVVAINFLYTRCPLPDVCPRLAYTFARLQQRFDGKPVRFLSISIDPEYDTVERLAAYAKIWKARDRVWRLLTGTWDEIRATGGYFGMIYWAEEGQMVHTSRTAIIARDGRLAAVVQGSRYVAGELGDLIEQELRR